MAQQVISVGLRDDHAGDNDKNYHGQGFSTGDRIAPMTLASVGGAFIQQSADFFTISGNSATPTDAFPEELPDQQFLTDPSHSILGHAAWNGGLPLRRQRQHHATA